MGYTGLACWINSPPNAVEIVRDNIVQSHGGRLIKKWQIQIRSYRSILDARQTQSHLPSRSMVTVTMANTLFAYIEDPAVSITDINTPGSPDVPLAAGDSQPIVQPNILESSVTVEKPPHRRNTFVTITPPEALDMLIYQLKARWTPVRQTGGGTNTKQFNAGGPQVIIDGLVFSIGEDWIVRAGNVIQAGGTSRGMLLEAEYLPLVHSPQPVLTPNDTAKLLQDLLSTIIPSTYGAKTIVFPICDADWDDILYGTDDREERIIVGDDPTTDESIYISAEDAEPRAKRGDWTGIYREKRSAFLIIGALRSEGVL